MRLLLAALLATTPVAALWYWVSGLFGGFRLFKKLPPWMNKWLRIYGWLTLFSAGAATSLLITKGCVSVAGMAEYLNEAKNSVTQSGVHKSKTSGRSLGQLAPPPFKILTRLRMESAKRSSELQKKEIIRVHGEARLAILYAPQSFQVHERTRKGPFCHVTCIVHHEAMYDRETLPELCNANWIPPETVDVPGWWWNGGKYEVTYAWPGPAVPGFHKYKLYWTDK